MMIDKPKRLPGEPDLPATAGAPEVALEILGVLQDIRFGSLEVVVHNGKVVQIERKEKFRFANDGRDRP